MHRKKRCPVQRKVRYKRRDLAHNAMLRKQRENADGKPMNTYMCEFCEEWHFGHKQGTGNTVWLGVFA